jgi:hypothetical protein
MTVDTLVKELDLFLTLKVVTIKKLIVQKVKLLKLAFHLIFQVKEIWQQEFIF